MAKTWNELQIESENKAWKETKRTLEKIEERFKHASDKCIKAGNEIGECWKKANNHLDKIKSISNEMASSKGDYERAIIREDKKLKSLSFEGWTSVESKQLAQEENAQRRHFLAQQFKKVAKMQESLIRVNDLHKNMKNIFYSYEQQQK